MVVHLSVRHRHLCLRRHANKMELGSVGCVLGRRRRSRPQEQQQHLISMQHPHHQIRPRQLLRRQK